MAYTPHVSDFKKKVVAEFVKLFKEYPIIGAVDMETLPAKQLQIIKAKLRDRCVILMTKRRLMVKAIEQAKVEGLDKLIPHLKGMPALLFSKENPFTLFKIIKQNKSKAPAKAGQTAPHDIKIPAGPTPFAPGPVIGELGALGIKSKVEAGKIKIIEDAIVCKEGEKISEQLAGMLIRLSIFPMEVGLGLVAVFEKGEILDKSVLDIDEEQFDKDLTGAILHALNLSVEAGYITKDNIEVMITKAVSDARGVAKECGVITDDLIDEFLAQGTREAGALVSEFGIDLGKASEEKKEEKKEEAPKEEVKSEEPKVEEKKEEPKPEEKPKEEPKVEEQKEEAKPEAPKEEPKVEEKKEEAKPEEPKVEEKPKEEVKEEQKEEKKPEEKSKPPKVEETPQEKAATQKIKQAAIQAREVTEKEVEEAKKQMEKNLEKQKEREKQEEVENLAKELLKKGTLRDRNKL